METLSECGVYKEQCTSQSSYVPGVQQCLSPRRNWNPHNLPTTAIEWNTLAFHRFNVTPNTLYPSFHRRSADCSQPYSDSFGNFPERINICNLPLPSLIHVFRIALQSPSSPLPDPSTEERTYSVHWLT